MTKQLIRFIIGLLALAGFGVIVAEVLKKMATHQQRP
jgi:hypothetical protein